jgi:hypothetical protein
MTCFTTKLALDDSSEFSRAAVEVVVVAAVVVVVVVAVVETGGFAVAAVVLGGALTSSSSKLAAMNGLSSSDLPSLHTLLVELPTTSEMPTEVLTLRTLVVTSGPGIT